MNTGPLHKYFIYNGEVRQNSDFLMAENSGGIYEVLRVSDGIPLFQEEHFDRFFLSAKLAGKFIPYTKMQLSVFLEELIHSNNVEVGNVLVSYKLNLKAFFIPHSYPDKEQVLNGIICGILYAERDNPHAKVFQTPVREKANEMMEKGGYYEVLLADHNRQITEGSRSNVFFVENNRLVTPPGKKVLLGITRQKTIQLAQNAGIPVDEKEIWINDLSGFQAAFITGTSPKILTVSQIEGWKFDAQNPVIQKLVKDYDDLILNYIQSKK